MKVLSNVLFVYTYDASDAIYTNFAGNARIMFALFAE